MCTAICYRSKSSYFGRNLDIDRGYGESVVITPRNYEIKMRCEKPLKSHYAMIGMAIVVEDYPLYYEATNENGLSMAGLNFPENAVYFGFAEEKDNITPFESFAYTKPGYEDAYELGPREIVKLASDKIETLSPASEKMKICAFLWSYYGYPNSRYEGRNVEVMRVTNGKIMARDEMARG